jgi:phage terminase large subunit-like protein
MVRAHWNTDYTRELEAFDGSERGKDDQVDGSSGAFNMLHERKKKALIGRA